MRNLRIAGDAFRSPKAFNILCRENKMWVEVRKVGFLPLTLFLFFLKPCMQVSSDTYTGTRLNGNSI